MRPSMVSASKSRASIVQQLLPLFLVCWLFSCGSTNPPRQIKITIPEDYIGDLHITPCKTSPSSADQQGNVSVTDCAQPSERIQLSVTQGARVFVVPPEKLVILRTGDGIPVLINTHIP
jgi:hypothetical protein